MHALHKILVYIPNVTIGDDFDREDLIEAIRDQAVSDTECYEGVVFDLRNTDTAGNWSEDFPCNVLLSKDNYDVFISEIYDSCERQRMLYESTLSKIKMLVGYNIFESGSKVFGVNSNLESNYDLSYRLGILGDLAGGHYTFESEFYDTNASTAKITENTINLVRDDPNNWALVMFDYYHC